MSSFTLDIGQCPMDMQNFCLAKYVFIISLVYPALSISYFDYYWTAPDIIRNRVAVFTIIYSFLYVLELAVILVRIAGVGIARVTITWICIALHLVSTPPP